MELFNNLQKVGLIFIQQNKLFPNLSKHFKLIVDDVNEQVFNTNLKKSIQKIQLYNQDPNDIAYVYSGYAPFSVRLCQHAIKQGWKSLTDDSNPGEKLFFEESQKLSQQSKKKSNNFCNLNSFSTCSGDLINFFEIAALSIVFF